MMLKSTQQLANERHDDVRYWIGDVRILRHHLDTNVEDPNLRRFVAAARDEQPMEIEVQLSHDSTGTDHTVVVWALSPSGLQKNLVWGAPAFRTHAETIPLQDELKVLMQAVTNHTAAGSAEVPQRRAAPVAAPMTKWVTHLKDVEKIVDLVKAKHHLKAEFDGDWKSGYSVQLRDFTAEWRNLRDPTGYEAVVWSTPWIDEGQDADEVFVVVDRLLTKLQELRDTPPRLAVVAPTPPASKTPR